MVSKRKAGIDVGGTLIKAAILDKNGLNFQSFLESELTQCAAWLKESLADAEVCLTGGGASRLREKLLPNNVRIISEFEATCIGVRDLLDKEPGETPDRFILTNCGTGTSIHFVNGLNHRRIGGSGIGGGTLVGLSELLTEDHGFDALIHTAENGRRDHVDLTVARIYEGDVPPIAGDLTASNFGLAAREVKGITDADKVASVIGLVAETVTTLSLFAAEKENVQTVVYIGSSFAGNPAMREIVMAYSKLRGIVPIIPKSGQFSGAIGALLSLEKNDR
ncbi:type II pantothenate kinase [Sporolactobacillus shoreae]|uniref:Type II pantothenate kinase n=1 Tax=Sporolactobacillus shoreae TaxID=1465501 RepID=A0A4Z0GKZ8_9BACL|nr:type II pantothenate kinase [Sporolactobacillus shoreae]TGA97028.1 type II pantothenate kinase [Sporolactobacillus shoreae]